MSLAAFLPRHSRFLSTYSATRPPPALPCPRDRRHQQQPGKPPPASHRGCANGRSESRARAFSRRNDGTLNYKRIEQLAEGNPRQSAAAAAV